jgi:hypothetical protein
LVEKSGIGITAANGRLVVSMDGLEQLAHDLRGFAAEVHMLGYSRSVVSGAEHQFIELSQRMIQCADALAAVEPAGPPLLQQSGTG